MEQFTSKSASVVVERLDPKVLGFCKSKHNPPELDLKKEPTVPVDKLKPCIDYPGKPKISSRVMSLQRIKLNEKHTKPFLFSLFQLKECDVVLDRVDLNVLRDTFINMKVNDNRSVKKPPEYMVTYITPECFELLEHQCKVCNKKYCSEKKLKNHVRNKHDVINEFQICQPKRVSFSDVVEIIEIQHHRCRKCLKLFDNYKLLKRHMKAKHKKRTKYVCNYCGKIFAERSIFKIHIKTHCLYCGNFFNDKKQLSVHRSTCTGLKINFKKSKTKPVWKVKFADNKIKKHGIRKTTPILKRDKKRIKIDIKEFISQDKQPVVLVERFIFPDKFRTHKDVDNAQKDLNNHNESQEASPSVSGLLKQTIVKIERFDVTNKPNQENTVLHQLLSKPMPSFAKFDANRPANLMNGHKPLETSKVKISHSRPVAKVTPKIVWNKVVKTKNSLQKTKVNNNFGSMSIFQTSKLHCEICNQYFRSVDDLESHKKTLHNARSHQCLRCEEHFVWESLLLSHKCIRDYNEADRVTSLNTSQRLQSAQYLYTYEVPIEF